MYTVKKPIKGYSRFSTDGAQVYLRSRLIKPRKGMYDLIPDGGDGINSERVDIDVALGKKVKKAKASTAEKVGGQSKKPSGKSKK